MIGRPGKSDKIPFDGVTGYNSNAQDTATWLTPDIAEAFAAEWAPTYTNGTGVGILIYQGSQLFCVDLDSCIDTEGVWSDKAREIVARFPGCSVEISASGRGLHIFGMYRGILPPHKSKNSHWHIELYTHSRFIALSGRWVTVGSVFTDCTEVLTAFAAEYFPQTGGAYSGEWTDEPAEGWNFLKDDAELLRWAHEYRDARSTFGAKASIASLLDADADALGEFFPHDTNPYDASDADLALASFLMWATGNNCERTLGLMNQTALKRSKWDRDDYIQGTVCRGTSKSTKWPPLRAAPMPPAAAVVPVAPIAAEPGTVPVPEGPPAEVPSSLRVGDYMTLEQQRETWDGCTYIRDLDGILMPAPKGGMLKERQFNATYGGHKFQVQMDQSGPALKAWDAFVYSEMFHFPRAEGLMFDPREAPGATLWRNGLSYINTWLPLDIASEPGDVSWFLEHIRKLWPEAEDAQIIVSFLKFMVQHKGFKAPYALFLQGVEGNGKSFISATMTYCLGERYTQPLRASQLDSRFNSHMYQKLFYPIEDMHTGESKATLWETLKPMITESLLEIEGKGMPSVTREMCGNFILNSNHKDGIRKTGNDRRIAPFFAAQQKKSDLARDGLTPEYFTRLWARAKSGGWANVLHYLATDPIADKYNPAVGATIAPVTSSTAAAIDASMGSAEQEVLDAAEQGLEGFAGGWVSSVALDRLLAKMGKERAIPKNKRRDMLETLGYLPHPGLPGGRVVTAIDGSKPRLYIREAHPLRGLTDPKTIKESYELAQRPT